MESQSPISVNSEDIFASIVDLEKIHIDEGFRDGYEDGLISGKNEAREVGLELGFEVGEELAFYRGCIDVWNSILGVERSCFSFRVQKNIKQMEELLQKYPILDPEDENVQEIMDALRLKFRAITATLLVRLENDGYPKASQPQEIGF